MKIKNYLEDFVTDGHREQGEIVYERFINALVSFSSAQIDHANCSTIKLAATVFGTRHKLTHLDAHFEGSNRADFGRFRGWIEMALSQRRLLKECVVEDRMADILTEASFLGSNTEIFKSWAHIQYDIPTGELEPAGFVGQGLRAMTSATFRRAAELDPTLTSQGSGKDINMDLVYDKIVARREWVLSQIQTRAEPSAPIGKAHLGRQGLETFSRILG